MFRKIRGLRTSAQVLAAAVVLGLLISSFALASGEGNPILGGKRNPGSNDTAPRAHAGGRAPHPRRISPAPRRRPPPASPTSPTTAAAPSTAVAPRRAAP